MLLRRGRVGPLLPTPTPVAAAASSLDGSTTVPALLLILVTAAGTGREGLALAELTDRPGKPDRESAESSLWKTPYRWGVRRLDAEPPGGEPPDADPSPVSEERDRRRSGTGRERFCGIVPSSLEADELRLVLGGINLGRWFTGYSYGCDMLSSSAAGGSGGAAFVDVDVEVSGSSSDSPAIIYSWKYTQRRYLLKTAHVQGVQELSICLMSVQGVQELSMCLMSDVRPQETTSSAALVQ